MSSPLRRAHRPPSASSQSMTSSVVGSSEDWLRIRITGVSPSQKASARRGGDWDTPRELLT